MFLPTKKICGVKLAAHSTLHAAGVRQCAVLVEYACGLSVLAIHTNFYSFGCICIIFLKVCYLLCKNPNSVSGDQILIFAIFMIEKNDMLKSERIKITP